MSYLLHTDWVAGYLLGQLDAVALLTELGRHGVAISIFTFMEVAEGMASSRSPRQAQRGFRTLLRGTRVVVSRPIAFRAAMIRLDLRRRNRPINHRVLDLVITATALEHGFTLVTRNQRDYRDVHRDVPALRLYLGPYTSRRQRSSRIRNRSSMRAKVCARTAPLRRMRLRHPTDLRTNHPPDELT